MSIHKGDQNFKNGYIAGYRACWATAAGGSSTSGGINWLAICRIPAVDIFLSEPCETLTTPDGYTLTAEGERVVRCIGGLAVGTLVLSYLHSRCTGVCKIVRSCGRL